MSIDKNQWFSYIYYLYISDKYPFSDKLNTHIYIYIYTKHKYKNIYVSDKLVCHVKSVNVKWLFLI